MGSATTAQRARSAITAPHDDPEYRKKLSVGAKRAWARRKAEARVVRLIREAVPDLILDGMVTTVVIVLEREEDEDDGS